MSRQFTNSNVEENYFHHRDSELRAHLIAYRELHDILRSVFKTRAISYSCIPDDAYEGLYQLDSFVRRHIQELEDAVADLGQA